MLCRAGHCRPEAEAWDTTPGTRTAQVAGTSWQRHRSVLSLSLIPGQGGGPPRGGVTTPQVSAPFLSCLLLTYTVSATPGNLLEFNGPPGHFCVRWSTALVWGHKTGYQIAYLGNWSPYFIFGTLHSRPKQCKHVLDFSWNPSRSVLEISWKFVQLNL